ncbi:MAG: hypothetical protein HOC20_13690 [Chloroflexi bacterium]|jgi:hypothetical protein|nr:hypothetical protein [Chloroflexota bacterium]
MTKFGIGEEFKRIIEQQNLIKFALPEITRPINNEDCPAAPVCEALGNLRGGCVKGGSGLPPPQACLAGLLLLFGRATGMVSPEMTDELKKQQPIGFRPETEGDSSVETESPDS